MSWTLMGVRKSPSFEPRVFKQIKNLGKHVKSDSKSKTSSKKNQKTLKQLAELVDVILLKLPTIPSSEMIAGNIIEFSKLNGISANKVFGKKLSDNKYYSLMLLNSLGIAFKYNVGKGNQYVLTRLGEVVRDATKGMDAIDRLAVASIAGLLFPTKVRIIAEAIASNVADARALYDNLKSSLGNLLPFKAYRPLIEIINELKLTDYGRLKGYITETHIALSVLTGLGMIDYNRKEMTFRKREEPGEYTLYINVPLMLRLINEYGDMRWILLEKEKEYVNKLMAPKEEINKLPKRYLAALQEIEKEKERIWPNLDTLYKL